MSYSKSLKKNTEKDLNICLFQNEEKEDILQELTSSKYVIQNITVFNKTYVYNCTNS